MVTPRQYHTATRLLDGRVLVAGGADATDLVAEAELFDPKTDSWTATGRMNAARYGHTATLLEDGTVLVAGGIGYTGVVLASAELYDPESGTWTPVASMSEARTAHAAVLLTDATVLVAGGSTSNTSGGEVASTEVFDPESGSGLRPGRC